MTDSIVERYVRLGLRLDRRVEGTVDSYAGPPELAAEVAAGDLPGARALVDEAEALLTELPDSWLRDQVAGLRTCAGMLAGESRSYADEVHGYYGVRPSWTDESVFTEAHERLDALLPGTGPLAERLEEWRRSMLVPADRVESTVATVIAEARRWTGQLIELPPGEGVDLEFVREVPWNGYNTYLGDLRGRVEINVDRPMTGYQLLHLVLHETYPGHQAERAAKENLLVRGQGRLEETIVLAPTPQSLIAEGIGEIAPEQLLRGEAGAALAGIVRDSGVDLDLAHSLTLDEAVESCRWASVNAALMLHEHEAGAAEVSAYLQRWEMLNPEDAGRVIRFVTDPTSRTYSFNYPAGRRLCRAYAKAVPDGFRRLLTEQVRVGDLLRATV
ncbi:hypothetical protein Lfu02_22000 [Longispora fulva]|uniref:DUF885 domain-containing protein n=1 Tax=Longispora fulva TaxID=619741 RepID=A0A8J7GFL0_9ACTN|nr:hypothetical protein [Longispora fulva]MBG6139788.1 hypothetical protein [Longispora fulva]GIG57828.1 hypothetical protein Lfu02_22000 [Longispora fulva]